MTYHSGPAFTLFLLALVSLSAACSDSSSGDTLGAYTRDAYVTKEDAVSVKGDSSGDASESSSDGSAVVVTVEKVITYDANQGVLTGPASVKVKDGETVSKPTEPTRRTYTFAGWYTEASAANQNETTRFKFKDEAGVTPDTVTSDMTLYAGWVPATLEGVVKLGKLPSDLSLYDEVTQAALGAYKAEATAGASVSAVFVTVSGGGEASNRDGKSWETAWAGTQLKEKLDGINEAGANHVYLFLVAAGEYKAGASLVMKDDVAIVGGWDGTGASNGWKRRATYVTNFKGDRKEGRRFSVFYNTGLKDKATLAYATVSDGSASYGGGGMYNTNSSPLLTNVTFSGNSAAYHGGGMFNYISSPVLMNVTFSDNEASFGGGVSNNNSSPVLMNVTFLGNSAIDNEKVSGGNGGGMFNNNNGKAAPTVVNSLFWGNKVGGQTQGSQIYLSNSEGGGSENLALYNCIVQGGIAKPGAPAGPLSSNTAGGGISVSQTDSTNGAPVSITYENVYGLDLTNHDPKLGALAKNGGSVETVAIGRNSFAINRGLYLRRVGASVYYSDDNSSWFTRNASAQGTPSPLPSGAIDVTATDARGYGRVGKPDIGAYEYGAVAP